VRSIQKYPNFQAWKMKEKIRDHGLRLPAPSELPSCAEPFISVMFKCWNLSPEARPSIDEVLKMLPKMYGNEDDQDAQAEEVEPSQSLWLFMDLSYRTYLSRVCVFFSPPPPPLLGVLVRYSHHEQWYRKRRKIFAT
jgi:hypothetical protein